MYNYGCVCVDYICILLYVVLFMIVHVCVCVCVCDDTCTWHICDFLMNVSMSSKKLQKSRDGWEFGRIIYFIVHSDDFSKGTKLSSSLHYAFFYIKCKYIYIYIYTSVIQEMMLIIPMNLAIESTVYSCMFSIEIHSN